jgi:hypothetical protein
MQRLVKNGLCSALIFAATFSLKAQNLVPNPSFENYIRLPNQTNLWECYTDCVDDWYALNTLEPHYTHLDADRGTNYGAPNPSRYQMPRSGKAATVYKTLSYWNRLYGFDSIRYYPTVKLKKSIPARAKVYAEFYTAWHGPECCRRVNQSFPGGQHGMWFYKDSLFQNNRLLVTATPQVNKDTLLKDTVNWTKIAGTFISSAELNYLSIGNFYPASLSQHEVPNFDWELQGGEAIYFLDDVYVRILDPYVPDTIYVCRGDTAVLTATGEENHAWALADNPSALLGTDSILRFKPITSTLVNFYGSFDTLSTYVQLVDLNLNLGANQVICQGDSIWLVHEGSKNLDSLRWNTGQKIDSLLVHETGWYTLTLYRGQCQVSDSVLIEVADTAALQIKEPPLRCLGQPVYLKTNADKHARITWNKVTQGDSLTVTDSGWYKVEKRHPCENAVDSIYVAFERCTCRIHVANAFTPNGDGLNDLFKPVYQCELSLYELKIANRWGQVIFATQDPTHAWDGGRAPPGLYLVYLRYQGLNEDGLWVEDEEHHTLRLLR